MGVIIPCCYNNSSIQKSLMKQETIKLPETHEETPEQYNKKISILEDGNPPQPPQHRNLSSNFLQAKINNIKNQSNNNNNRRKSFSIAINPDTLNLKTRNRSKSIFGINLYEDITNLQMKKAYKILPNQNVDKENTNNQQFAKSLSLISIDTTTSVNSPEPKKRKPIENINEPFTDKQLRILKKILFKEGLIIDDMDESTINMIINTISYIRVKPRVIIHTKENRNDNIYYIIDKGKLEYIIDDKLTEELTRHMGIGTRALDLNSNSSCILKSVDRCYLFCLPIEKYKTIAQDFIDRQLEEKNSLIKNHFFFKNLTKGCIENLAKHATKLKYTNRTVICPEDKFSEAIYIVGEGLVICTKGDIVVKKILQGDIFGEIGLFNNIESLYCYTAETDSILLQMNYEDFIMVLGESALKTIVFSIFTYGIQSNELLHKFLSGDNIERVFKMFQLKFYFNETILTPHQKKLIIPISGTAFKSIHLGKDLNNLCQNIINSIDDSLEKGKLFIEPITLDSPMSYNIVGDECVVFEGQWDDVVRALPKASDSDITIFQKINLIKNHPLFKYLSEFKLFQLSNRIGYEQYKPGQIILRDGPSSDRFYIIKSGSVKLQIQRKTVKSLEANHTFGDISSQVGEYSRKADFIAIGRVECYYIEKEVYDDIVDKDNLVLTRLKTIMHTKDITISLENLFYLRELGCGAYGKVYLVHDSKRYYAMKTAEIQILSQKKEMAQMYMNEKAIMFSIDHPFIIQLINTFKTREYIFFLIEYADGISLRDHINKKQKDQLRNLDEARFYASILSSVLNYLQKKRIIHRDLKPENLMFDQNGYLKVIDFGVAKNLTSKDYTNTFIGTTSYLSPEVILGKHYNYAVDYWAVGIILHELFYGKIPFGFGSKDENSVYKEITEKKVVFPSDKRNEVFNSLIKSLLNKNPNKRLNSFQKIKSHAFFNGFDFDSLFNMKLTAPIKIDVKNKINDFKNVEFPFTNFMRNTIYTSSNELDELLKQNGDDFLSDF